MKNNPYNSIASKVITVQQLKEFIQLLRESHQALYDPKVNTQETLEKSLPFFLAEIIIMMADKKSIPLDNKTLLQNLIDDMRKYLESLSVAEIVLPFVPTYRQVMKISDWWEEYTGTHVILAITIDENIIAGTKISYNGIYKDYSLSQWIKQKGDQFI